MSNDSNGKILSGITIPCRDGEYPVPLSRFEQMCKRYPRLNVEREFKLIQRWCEDNPSRRKTRLGVKAFIGNWFRMADRYAQDQAHEPAGAPAPGA